MTTTQKLLSVAGAVAIVAGVALVKPAATTSTPPGWDYCTMPSYYTRACEASPMTLRWSGGPAGSCPNIAICGAHTKPCIGEDGVTYAMGDQNMARTYPRPQASAGAYVLDQYHQCYDLHIDVWGPSYPCHSITHVPGGTQAPTLFTFAQLPPGPQKTAWGNLFHCTGATPSPSPSATLTPTSGCTPREVTRIVVVTPTKSVSLGPNPTKNVTNLLMRNASEVLNIAPGVTAYQCGDGQMWVAPDEAGIPCHWLDGFHTIVGNGAIGQSNPTKVAMVRIRDSQPDLEKVRKAVKEGHYWGETRQSPVLVAEAYWGGDWRPGEQPPYWSEVFYLWRFHSEIFVYPPSGAANRGRP